jgi:hypothetical protein
MPIQARPYATMRRSSSGSIGRRRRFCLLEGCVRDRPYRAIDSRRFKLGPENLGSARLLGGEGATVLEFKGFALSDQPSKGV